MIFLRWICRIVHSPVRETDGHTHTRILYHKHFEKSIVSRQKNEETCEKNVNIPLLKMSNCTHLCIFSLFCEYFPLKTVEKTRISWYNRGELRIMCRGIALPHNLLVIANFLAATAARQGAQGRPRHRRPLSSGQGGCAPLTPIVAAKKKRDSSPFRQYPIITSQIFRERRPPHEEKAHRRYSRPRGRG